MRWVLQMKAGHELDALVAEKVMGWHIQQLSSYSFAAWFDSDNSQTGWTEEPDDYDSLRYFIGVWHPSTNIEAAWEVVERVKDWRITLSGGEYEGDGWSVGVTNNTDTYYGLADTAPLAICLAALKACGVDTE